MSSETIIFGNIAPVRIDHSRAFIARANAVLPMIFISKTSAGPSKHRNLNLPQCLYDIISDSIGVWNFRILSDPNTTVNAIAEMLGKLPVDIFVDSRSRVRSIHYHCVHLSIDRC